MLRRTMSVKRDSKRKDDETLVRHIYDVHCITTEHKIDMDVLKPIFDIVLEEDKRRYGTQHQEFVDNPRNELKLGLVELETNVEFRNRFNAFVAPMVYSSEPCDFDTCFNSFKDISEQLIA